MSYLHLNNVIAINKFVYNNRIKAAEIAKEEGLLSNSSAFRKKNRFKSKEEIKREEEQILRKIIEEKLDIKEVIQNLLTKIFCGFNLCSFRLKLCIIFIFI